MNVLSLPFKGRDGVGMGHKWRASRRYYRQATPSLSLPPP